MTLDSNCSEFPNNSDTISRQAAIDAVDKYDFEFPQYMEKFVAELRDAMKADLKCDIANLPSAEPERKKGEWIEFTNTNHTYVCSVCGRMLVNITDGKNTVTKNYPFCHCGADMRGSDA